MRIKIIIPILMTIALTNLIPRPSIATQNHPVTNVDKQLAVMTKLVNQLQTEINTLKMHTKKGHAYEHKLVLTTSPYIGLKSADDASDLTVNSPTINQDLFFLRQREQLERRLHAEGSLFADRSVLEVGGGLEGQALTGFKSKTRRSSTDLDLTRADINLLAQISPWAIGFMNIAYDNSPLLPVPGGLRIANSRFFLSRGFVTVGNLNQSPVYATFGQMYAPFGRYASNLLSPPVTLKLGRTTGRALLLGYDHDGFNGSVYTFHGDNWSHHATGLNQWGANIAYKYVYGDYKVNIGAGYIANIIDAKGMRNEWLTCGSGDGLTRRIPAMDFHGEFSQGPYDLFAEYVGATESFAPNDLSINGHGARPQALHLELAYHPKTIKPSTVGAGYGQSWQTFNMPQKSVFAVASTSLWKNTVETVEYRHDILSRFSNTGKQASNAVVGQVGFYF